MMPFKRVTTKHLGELMVDNGIIVPQQLDKALEIQREKGGLLGQILVNMGFITEEQIAQALTVQYGFPFLPLESYDITPEIVKIIPEEFARLHNLIAIDRIEDLVTIAMSNPLNKTALEEVEKTIKCKVQVFVSTMSDINNAINKSYGKKQ